MGIKLPYHCPEIVNRSLGKGTKNLYREPAMTREQAKRARRVWKQTIDRLQKTVPLPRRAWLKWIRCLY